MSHFGRGHEISTQAEEIVKRIGKSSSGPEQKYLRNVASTYNEIMSIGEQLLAHGVSDISDLCQILIDGELKHNMGIENYGNLASSDNVSYGGYYDFGCGLVVVNCELIPQRRYEFDGESHFKVPLKDTEAILLPNGIVGRVRNEFPQHKCILKGYGEFAFGLGVKQLKACLDGMQRFIEKGNPNQVRIIHELYKQIYANTFPGGSIPDFVR